MTLPPLPTGHTIGGGIFNGQKLFTADQMREYGAACAATETERCAVVCEAETRLGLDDERAYYGRLMAEAIRRKPT